MILNINNILTLVFETYILQSMIGRKIMESQLKKIGAFNANDSISAYPHFDRSFKICKCSLCYINFLWSVFSVLGSSMMLQRFLLEVIWLTHIIML